MLAPPYAIAIHTGIAGHLARYFIFSFSLLFFLKSLKKVDSMSRRSSRLHHTLRRRGHLHIEVLAVLEVRAPASGIYMQCRVAYFLLIGQCRIEAAGCTTRYPSGGYCSVGLPFREEQGLTRPYGHTYRSMSRRSSRLHQTLPTPRPCTCALDGG